MPGPESAHVRPTPPALDHAALLAVADGAPPVLVVSCTAPGRRCTPQVEHANPAARELLGIDTADTADTVAVPSTEAARGAGDRPRHWMRVLTELVDAGDIDPRAWHTASTPSPVGLPITLRLRVQPLADGTRFLVWMRATTDELALAEEAAADAENRFQRLAQSAAVGIVASDVGARLSFVNAAFAAILGGAPHDLGGAGLLRRLGTHERPARLGDR
ncbi:MAG: PAS domain-containing protein, partial [Jatrophihabitans sp.]|uniref:PAS domain-containing protein n=1 Tax=Jatrophihabitans sp. TaxID=1932789 RepID=UPI003F80951A